MTAPRPRLVVVGGGAAGLLAAGRAAEVAAGRAEVLLLESTDAPGHKLALTGNGRGNLTNAAPVEEHVRRLGPNGPSARNALYRFGPAEALAFWQSLGLPLEVAPDGRAFPRTGRAADAVERLVAWCRRGGVTIRTGAAASALLVEGGRIRGVRLSQGGTVAAEAAVLATGGWSWPRTGSRGDGWRLAAEVGHTVHAPAAGLVPLVTAEPRPEGLAGVSLAEVAATAERDGRVLARARGGLLFTHDGLSGPAILTLSLHVARALAEGPLTARLDLLPGLSEPALDAHLREVATGAGRGTAQGLFQGLLPRALGQAVLAAAGLPGDLRLAALTARQRREAAATAKGWAIAVARARPLREAMVTVGGVDVAEVEPTTMASRRVVGLYLAGELLDVAGETGGYNLHYAFASGRLAGESAARALAAAQPPIDRRNAPA